MNQRNKRQRNNQDQLNPENRQDQQNQANQRPRTQLDDREIVATNFRDAQIDVYKDITYYEYLTEQEIDKMCLKLYEIMSIEKSLPNLENNEDLIIFMKFIQKLIFSIKVKQGNDLESTKKQLKILQDTLLGFLSVQNFENSIQKRLTQKDQNSLKNKKYLLNNEQSNEFKILLDDIIQYTSGLEDNKIFQKVKNSLGLAPRLNIEIIEDLINSENNSLEMIFKKIDQIQDQIPQFKLDTKEKKLCLLHLTKFLIETLQKANDDDYSQQSHINMVDKCIIECLKKEELIQSVKNWNYLFISKEQIELFVFCLQAIAKYSPKKQDQGLIKIYKFVLFDVYENLKGIKIENNQNNDGKSNPEERQAKEDDIQIEFDEEIIQEIAAEKKVLELLGNYKRDVDLDTNVFPDDSDCRFAKNYRGFLKRRELKKKYKDQLEYLENMFSFLRADSHQEVVLGMNCAIKLGNDIQVENMTSFENMQKELSSFRVLNSQFNFYNHIEMIRINLQKGIILTLNVSPILPKKNIKLNLESSKRLIGDQYVYLTDFNLQKLYVCQIQNEYQSKDLKKFKSQLNNLQIKLKVIDKELKYGQILEDIKQIIFQNRAIIIEPKEYFGQYMSCMEAIKNMITNKFRLPFQENLINLEQKISMPAFIDEDTQYILDFSPLNEEQEEEKEDEEDIYNNDYQINMRNYYLQKLNGDWKNIPTLKYLNQSQADAIKNILTKEISIIQGPPGTGKTYVGAMAMRNILKNSKIWNPNNNVILMCCKTNHALDQFLSHIIKFEKNVVRVGSRSKLEEIKQFQLNEYKKNFRQEKSSFRVCQKVEEKLSKSIKYFSDKLFENQDSEELIKMLPKDIVRSCCKEFLLQFCALLPFVQIRIDDILEDESLFNQIAAFWWQMNPNFKDIHDQLFIPLIDKYADDQNKEIYIMNIEIHFTNYQNRFQIFINDLYYSKNVLNKGKSNFFYEQSEDDQSDEEEEEKKQEQSLQILWKKIITQRNAQSFNYQSKDDEIDEFDYAEDRENYIVEEDYDELILRNNRKRKQQNEEQNKKDFVYFTYFQFMTSNLEKDYQDIELQIRSTEDLLILDFNQQITLRLKAISNLSQIYKENLFNQQDLQEYEKQVERLRQEEIYSDILIMKKMKIVAMTLGGICKYSEYLKHLKYDMLLIEEAAEVLENLTVPLLQPFLKQLILIGDHQQLKPTAFSHSLEKDYNMNISLFQRLVANEVEYVCLNEQMRMSPQFSDYVRIIYNKPNQYRDSEFVKKYDTAIRGLPSNIMFFMHSYDEESLNYTTTKKNEKEAKLSVALANYIINQKQFTPSQITILSMYLGQSLMIKQQLNSYEDLKDIRVSTIDNYQGEENEFIILSLVRSNPKNMGFVKISNRINVSISRAKKGFVILGNKRLLTAKDSLWRQIFDKARKNNHIFTDKFRIDCPQHNKSVNYSDPSSFNNFCTLKCIKQNLKCKHECKNKCHPGECDEFGCKEPIQVICDGCKGSNKIECSLQDKKDQFECQRIITIQNMCGHNLQIQCHKFDYGKNEIKEEYENFMYEEKCQSKCGAKLRCGHKCQEKCHFVGGQKCDALECKVNVQSTKLACGHPYTGVCGKQYLHQCKQIVKEKKLPCGHVVNNAVCSQIIKCLQPCGKILECGHQCIKQKCFEVHQCDKKSQRKLKCGHSIYEYCQKDLSNYQCNEISNKPLECGHGNNIYICSEADKFQCQKNISVELPCSHIQSIQCYQKNDLSKIQCQQSCLKILQCGHPCQNICWQKCTDNCEFRVQNQKRSNCEHYFTGLCHEAKQPCKEIMKFENKPIRCNEFQKLNAICNKTLSCGHRCKQKFLSQCICKEEIELDCCHIKIYCFEQKRHNCDDDNFI